MSPLRLWSWCSHDCFGLPCLPYESPSVAQPALLLLTLLHSWPLSPPLPGLACGRDSGFYKKQLAIRCPLSQQVYFWPSAQSFFVSPSVLAISLALETPRTRTSRPPQGSVRSGSPRWMCCRQGGEHPPSQAVPGLGCTLSSLPPLPQSIRVPTPGGF